MSSLKKRLRELHKISYFEKRKTISVKNLVNRMKFDLQRTASVASEFHKVRAAVMVKNIIIIE
jgi:hypothetical protein